MSVDLVMPLVPEVALFALALIVLAAGLIQQGHGGRSIGAITLIGLLAVFGLTFAAGEGRELFGGSFVQDGLALFAKRLFLGSAALSVLGSLTLRQGPFSRRSAEYHFALLVSLVGMLVLASSRDLVLLFVAFELMSIPLYLLTGFRKKERQAPEAALKFFLVGTASAAVIVYGMSFIYGATGSTALAAIPGALAEGNPLVLLGMALLLAGLGFKIAAFPFHMWAPDSYEAASTPFVAWLSVAPKAAGFVAIIRIYIEGAGPAAEVWLPLLAGMAGATIVTGNLMAIPQRNIKRLLAYSGVAHIGYMLIGLAALSVNGVAMVLFYLVAYLFGNMGAFPGGRDGVADRRLRRSGCLPRPSAALAAAGAGDAALPALARRDPVRGWLLGQALRVLGGSRTRPLRAGLARCRPHGGGALLLPDCCAEDVHRRARARDARRCAWPAWRCDRGVRRRRRGHRCLPRPPGWPSLPASPRRSSSALPFRCSKLPVHREPALGDKVLGDNAAAQEVLLDDPLQHRRVARAVPGAFRVDDRDRPALANPQAVGLRAEDAAALGELQFAQAPLQVGPSLETAFLLAALRHALVAAEQDVPLCNVDAERRRDSLLRGAVDCGCDGGYRSLAHSRMTSTSVPSSTASVSAGISM